ncbi:MAG: hypothetical protein LBL90_08265, partial [Prevotellaceae bacterium]|nr:hypothetical protein [Prevotellaceae bacterium]
MKHKEANERKTTTDAGIITVALLAARYFADNIESSLSLVRYTSLIPNIFSKSWVNRRLHKIGEVFSELF